MFFPDCESLACENEGVRNEIARVDKRLHSLNRDAVLVSDDFAPFVDISVDRLADILDVLTDRGLLIANSMARCESCRTLIPFASNNSEDTCECTSCGIALEVGDDTFVKTYRLAKRAWPYLRQKGNNMINEGAVAREEKDKTVDPEDMPLFNPDDFTIHLALSGGGLRATLFHVGVLRFLKQAALLDRVSVVCSVSGGSIAAAHLATHWNDYCGGDDDLFVKTAEKLINGAARWGIRERIDFSLLNPDRRFNQLRNCYLKGLSKDRSDTPIKDLIKSPEFHILGTDFATGRLVDFSQNGITQYESREDGTLRQAVEPHDDGRKFGLWRAAACSSAFPPMFAPHLIPPKDYEIGSGRNLTVGDGGVYDNLGIRVIDSLANAIPKTTSILFIVSDAGQPFRNAPASKLTFRWFMDRLVRASDIQFFRLADSDMLRFTHQHKLIPNRKVMRINIGDVVPPVQNSNLPSDIQEFACRVRTDLDAFSDAEIHTLIWHGWELAREQWTRAIGLPKILITKINWLPAGMELTEDFLSKELKNSATRKVHVFWPLMRMLFSWPSAVLILTLMGIWGRGSFLRYVYLKPETIVYSAVDGTIKDFPPKNKSVTSLVRGFRHLLPDESQDFFLDIHPTFETSQIAISVLSGNDTRIILRSWAFTRSNDSDEPSEIIWIDDEEAGEVIKRGKWEAGIQLRIVFAISNVTIEELKAQVRLSP